MFTTRDEYWLQQALQQAELAASLSEVPVGAVLVRDEQIIGIGHNAPITTCDPTAHAEIIALRQAARVTGNYRLINTTLYVTLEPCMMCVGAIIHARVNRVIYGAKDPKAGAVVSQSTLFDQPFLNHRVQHAGGLLAERCSLLLSQFFQARRS